MIERRPGGRSARVREAALAAAADLTRERGIGEVTLSDIAERSGVNRATLYRRWGTLDALMADMTMHSISTGAPLADTGSLRGDLYAWAIKASHDIPSENGALLLRSMVMTLPVTDEVRALRVRYLEHRYRELAAVLERARERGESGPTVDELYEIVLAPMYLRVLMDYRPLSEEYAKSLVDRVLSFTRP
nr:TetR/AcrR family transcriptional regulator [Kibdelosporangium sp. MJ126-NF4]CEL12849.1 Transcriptional regulator, TetR family [Kibdelosporangium sp. MJ126-NF4]CTQ98535.1 Transcriptional regulator, TetR family [Kibdelosporangium sp. MJ126-NF4]